MHQGDELLMKTKLDNQTAKLLILNMMEVIKHQQTVDGLRSAIHSMEFGDDVLKKAPGEKFPRMRLRLAIEEMNELKKCGVLTEELQLSSRLSSGVLANGQEMSTLEKLLYSVLWKNGDLGKERHIVEGVYGSPRHQKTGTVFYEFGGYLQGRNTFILDQHTLRCFAVASCADAEIKTARQFELIDNENSQHRNWMSAYTDFYKGIEQRISQSAADYLYEVDRLFFGAGKLIKLKKNGAPKSWRTDDLAA
jgi:hypothetical protein